MQGLLAQPLMENVEEAANHDAGQPWRADPAPHCESGKGNVRLVSHLPHASQI